MEVCRWDGGGGRVMLKCVFSQGGRWGKTSDQTFSNLFLKTLTEGAVTTEAGSLCRPCPSAVARALEYLEEVPS